MTTYEAILTKILDCGTADLSMLNDVDYDLDDIIQDCIDNDCLSLHGIFQGIFYKAARDLQDAFDEQKDDIRETILEELENEKRDFVDSGEMTEEELAECEEHKELIADLELIDNDELSPDNDVGFYLNYLDTHVYMKHVDFYRRWMNGDIDRIEDYMGWTFEDRNWD